jgi:hypothetical protein
VKALLAGALAALVLSPAAAAHGGGGTNYRSAVTSVTPAEGLTAVVLDRDDRLRLTAERETTIVGYQQEPYLRFTDGGVYRNARSPATYLNEARFGGVDVPADADPKATPRWVRVADGRTYEWHDHRIHWMSTIPPRQVRDAPNEPHHVFDWRVPISVEGTPGAIAGTLDYEPSGSRFQPVLIVPLAALALAAAGVWWARRRRSESA